MVTGLKNNLRKALHSGADRLGPRGKRDRDQDRPDDGGAAEASRIAFNKSNNKSRIGGTPLANTISSRSAGISEVPSHSDDDQSLSKLAPAPLPTQDAFVSDTNPLKHNHSHSEQDATVELCSSRRPTSRLEHNSSPSASPRAKSIAPCDLDTSKGNNSKEIWELEAPLHQSSAATKVSQNGQMGLPKERQEQNNGGVLPYHVSPPETWQDGSNMIVELNGAREELRDVEVAIREAARERVTEQELNLSFKRDGVDGALLLLLDSYKPTVDEMRRIENQIQRATKNFKIQDDKYWTVYKKDGVEGALELVFRHFHRAISAEHAVSRIIDIIQTSTSDTIPRRELDHASDHQRGVEGMVAVVVEKLKSATASQKNLIQLGEQIRDALCYIPRKERDTAFETAGERGLMSLLLRDFSRFSGAEQEFSRFEEELRNSARNILTPKELQDNKTEQVLKLFIGRIEGNLKETACLVDELEEQVKKGDSQCRKLKSDKHELERVITSLRSETAKLHQRDKDQAVAVADLKRSYADQLDEIERKWRADLKAQQANAAEQLRSSENSHKKQLEACEASHRSKLGQWEKSLQTARQKHRNELAELQKQYNDLTSEHDSQISQMRNEMEARLQDERHMIMEENQKLKGALAHREHIKGLSDQDIQTMFKKLAREVDNFSRVSWEKRKQSQWPLPDSIMMRAKNPKKLKQLIVQNEVWIILNEQIFHSPFAIFGNGGKMLHREWVSEFDEDNIEKISTWPEAGEDSEKRRYELVKEYLAAAKSSQPSAGEGNRWKESYQQHLNTTAIEIYNAVETVANTDLAWSNEIAKHAAEFWVDLATQRYRARLYLPQQAAKTLMPRIPMSSSALSLVIRPEVRRRGNAQGQRLGREQVVQGCDAEATSSDKL